MLEFTHSEWDAAFAISVQFYNDVIIPWKKQMLLLQLLTIPYKISNLSKLHFSLLDHR